MTAVKKSISQRLKSKYLQCAHSRCIIPSFASFLILALSLNLKHVSQRAFHHDHSSQSSPYSHFDYGMPNKTYSLEELRLCDPNFTKKFTDCNDITCLSCVQNLEEWATITYKYIEELHARFQQPENIEIIRKAAFDQIGAPKEHSVITVISVSTEFVELFHNFASSPLASDYIVATTNEEARQKAIALGYSPLEPFYFHPDGHRFRTAVIMQTFLGGALTKLGYNVLFQDADVMWIQDPRPWLVNQARTYGHDIMAQLGPRLDSMGPMNTGFVFISNHRTEVSAWFMRNIMRSFAFTAFSMGDDQTIWNTFYKHVLFRQVHIKLLPYDKFAIIGFDDKDLTNVITAHAVGQHLNDIGKTQKLKKHGLWYIE